MSSAYTSDEEALLRRSVKEAVRPLHCPRCGGTMRITPVVPPPDVPYVRTRVILECKDCRRRTALDR